MDKNINKPKLSIILPVYNSAKYVKQAMESVLQQSFKDFELIIINDGSTDNGLEIIKSFNDPRIILIEQENKGLIETLNYGVALAKADLIGRIDADDIWSDENKLSKQIEYLNNNQECVVVGTWAKIINEEGETTSHLSYPTTDKKIRSKILIKNCFIHPSVIFSKDAYLKTGGFDKQDLYVEDYGLWLKIGSLGTFANIPEYLMSYRVHGGSVTQQKNYTQSKNSLELIKKYGKIYPNYLIGYIKWNLKLILLKTIW